MSDKQHILFFYIHVKNKPLWKCMLNILKAHHSTQRSKIISAVANLPNSLPHVGIQ